MDARLGEPELSPGLRELVSARIGQLPQAQRHGVEVLALREPLGVSLGVSPRGFAVTGDDLLPQAGLPAAPAVGIRTGIDAGNMG